MSCFTDYFIYSTQIFDAMTGITMHVIPRKMSSWLYSSEIFALEFQYNYEERFFIMVDKF